MRIFDSKLIHMKSFYLPLHNIYTGFILLICASLVSCTKESTTEPPTNQNSHQWVNSTIVYNGNLIAAGMNIFGNNSTNIAQWNGSSWSPFTAPFSPNDEINCLAIYKGNLIAAGVFSSIGGISANSIAQWNGSSWQPLGSGVGGMVYSMTIYNGNLIAAGHFGTAGSITSNMIAQWNGSNWLPLNGINGVNGGIIYSVAVYNGKLIAAGNFTSAGSVLVNNIAQWNDTSWQALGKGINDSNSGVNTLIVYNNNLIAQGGFDSVGSKKVYTIAQWNGTVWSSLGNEPLNTGNVLGIFNGNLIAATATGGNIQISQWNGSAWSTPNSWSFSTAGSNSPYCFLSTFCSYNGNLIVGGVFSYADGIPANCIAQWNGTTWSAL
jgi:hypothetical protein